jgi:hypothetical protein
MGGADEMIGGGRDEGEGIIEDKNVNIVAFCVLVAFAIATCYLW